METKGGSKWRLQSPEGLHGVGEFWCGLFATLGTQFKLTWRPGPSRPGLHLPLAAPSSDQAYPCFCQHDLASQFAHHLLCWATVYTEPLADLPRAPSTGATDLASQPRQVLAGGPEPNSLTSPSLGFPKCKIRVILPTHRVSVITEINESLTNNFKKTCFSYFNWQFSAYLLRFSSGIPWPPLLLGAFHKGMLCFPHS